MMKMSRELNYVILYGNIKKVSKKKATLDFGAGDIKIVPSNPIIELLEFKSGYIVNVSGRLRKGFFRHYLIIDNATILATNLK